MYLFVKRAYRSEKENTDILVNRSLDKLKEYTSRRQDAYPVGEVLRTDRGKPYFKGGKVIFSVSHIGDMWVCLMGMTEKDLSLGVDIQQIRESRYRELADRYFSAGEKELAGQAAPEQEQKERFFAIWTEKEACGKALGTGIGKSLLAEDTEAVCEKHGLMLRRIDVAEGYMCSCCVPGELAGEEIIIREI